MKYEANVKLQEFSSTNQDTDRKVNFGYRTPDNLHYQITLETAPGRGMFEATVTIVSNEIVVNPYISRTNVYGDQPSCIAKIYPYVRKYCVCRKKPRWFLFYWKIVNSFIIVIAAGSNDRWHLIGTSGSFSNWRRRFDTA